MQSTIHKNPMLHTNITALCLIEQELLPIEVLHCENSNFRPFWLPWPWPWPDDLHIRTWPVVRGRMYKYELPKSSLSKVIVWQIYRQTWPKLYTTLLRWWSIMIWTSSHSTSLFNAYKNNTSINNMRSYNSNNETVTEQTLLWVSR